MAAHLQSLSFDFCDAWYFPSSQGRVVQGYLPVHKDRCVSYQDLHRATAPTQPREEDSAPAPPAALAKPEYALSSRSVAEQPSRRRAVRRTDPLDMEERLGPLPTHSHDSSAESGGLTSQQIECLRESVYEEEGELECLCAEKVKPGQRVKTLTCGHIFHSKCITRALFHSNKCPFDGIEAL